MCQLALGFFASYFYTDSNSYAIYWKKWDVRIDCSFLQRVSFP